MMSFLGRPNALVKSYARPKAGKPGRRFFARAPDESVGSWYLDAELCLSDITSTDGSVDVPLVVVVSSCLDLVTLRPES